MGLSESFDHRLCSPAFLLRKSYASRLLSHWPPYTCGACVGHLNPIHRTGIHTHSQHPMHSMHGEHACAGRHCLALPGHVPSHKRNTKPHSTPAHAHGRKKPSALAVGFPHTVFFLSCLICSYEQHGFVCILFWGGGPFFILVCVC